jgi:hypothetical protein
MDACSDEQPDSRTIGVNMISKDSVLLMLCIVLTSLFLFWPDNVAARFRVQASCGVCAPA